MEKGDTKRNRRITGKRFTALVLWGTVVMVLLSAGLVALVDPYFLYHKPLEGIEPVVNRSWASIRNDEMFKNPGMAEFFDYDAVILGSSVTENYKASWFSDAFDCNAVKLSYSNAQSENFDIILNRIFDAKESEVKKVFLALDTTILGKSAEETSYQLPDMIYKRKPWHFPRYFLNKNVYIDVVETLILNGTDQVPPLDEAYRWEGQFEYSKESALEHSPRRETVDPMMQPYGAIEYCKANLKNITPYMEEHPETEFYIIFSPYSILYWDQVKRNGEYEQVLFNTRLAMETLLQYDNVRIFYFQNDEPVIGNLDHYMDFIHFSAEINRYMVDCMAKGEKEVTEENYLQQLEQMKKIVENYDFDGIYEP